MRISVISRSWPCHERSGVTLAAAAHVRLLAAAGHQLSIIGSNPEVVNERLPGAEFVHVPSAGSGALYSPARSDRGCLATALRNFAPNMVIIEGWQTALTTAAVEVSSALGIPVLMISHGVSLHPFTWQLTDVVRALGWQPYKRFVFPKLIAKIDVLTTLDETASSQRFFDRDLARRLGKPVLPLVNAPANWTSCFRNRNQRKMQVLVVGYFSPIKNQLGALEVFSQLPNELQLKFVGERSGRYYEKCVRRVIELGLTDRVVFLEDSECNLEEEFANSLVVLSPSVTEVLPLTLIEAMASGTPFVATRVGAVPLLEGGFHASDIVGLKNSIRLLIDDTEFWQQCSDAGRRQYTERYTLAHVEAQLHDAIGATMNASAGKIKDFLVSERSVSEDLVMTASDDN